MRLSGKQQGGFTLIEVMMVLAIASLMAVILFTTFGRTRQRTQFTDAIERVATSLERAKTEANSSYTSGSGTTQGRAFFARAVLFSNGAGDFQTVTLTADRFESGNSIANIVQETNFESTNIPWGVLCSGNACNTAIVFSRDLGSGILNTYVIDKNISGGITNALNYPSGSGNDINTLTLDFVSPEGLQAQITINASTNEVKRSYTN